VGQGGRAIQRSEIQPGHNGASAPGARRANAPAGIDHQPQIVPGPAPEIRLKQWVSEEALRLGISRRGAYSRIYPERNRQKFYPKLKIRWQNKRVVFVQVAK
jgi:hypothetical protein